MKFLVSSQWLFDVLSVIKKDKTEITGVEISQNHLIFDSNELVKIKVGIEKLRGEVKSMLFKKSQWENIRKALEHFPEQPIVMEFQDDKISISQCSLWFYNTGAKPND